MAILLFTNHHAEPIDHDKAEAMWLVQHGYRKGTQAQMRYLQRVKRIYLSKHTAPHEYKALNGLEELEPIQRRRMEGKD